MSARTFCTVTASTKRNSTLSGGRTGAPAAHLVSLAITPLWPTSQETINTLSLNSPRETKECFHVPAAGGALPDVRERDILTVGGVDYPIQYVGEWSDGDVPTLHIVVQEVKAT